MKTSPAADNTPLVARRLEHLALAIDQLHDRIDLLFERTDGVRLAAPSDPSISADIHAETGAYVIDGVSRAMDRVDSATGRLDMILSELEV